MNKNWPNWKKITAAALGLLLVADVALIVFLFQVMRQGPDEMRAQRDMLTSQEKLLRADVHRGEQIRASLPQVGKDCDAFYKMSFLDSTTGYSQIDTDLGEIAQKAGVKTTGFSFKQDEIKGRGVTEITISTSVDADYPGIIQFINGLERSNNFYMLGDLHLNSANAGMIRLDLSLRTYVRT
jgi:hypothetical protein